MNAPASTFANDFRTHVVPRLRREIAILGPQVALGVVGWGEAHSCIVDMARTYGAMSLPPRRFDELIHWIDRHLLHELLSADVGIEAAKRKLAEREETDPVGYYSELAAGSRVPSVMRWVFASISPAYRAHLRCEARHA